MPNLKKRPAKGRHVNPWDSFSWWERFFPMAWLSAVAVIVAMPQAMGAEPLADTRHRFAVVVGIESYDLLPDHLRVENARQDATLIGEALDGAAYDQVRILTDSSATRENLEALLSDDLSSKVGPGDLLMLYFVGLGVGGDFGQPRLLMYETDPDALEQTSWAVADLGEILRRDIQAGYLVLITDASHEGELNGLALMGPTADSWPEMPCPSMEIASTGPREASVPGVFAQAFAQAIGGAADQSADGQVSSGELFRFILNTVPAATDDRQHPTVNARYDPSFTLGLVDDSTHATQSALSQGPRIDKVKFLIRDGISGTVQCRDGEVVLCDPSCYLWDVPVGECEVSAVSGQNRQQATVEVSRRGRVLCSMGPEGLSCGEGP